MRIVQFLPYFTPYEGELSSVAGEFSKSFVREKHGEVLNVVFSGNSKGVDGYEKDGYKVIYLPSFSLGFHHFVFKIWSKKFWNVIKEIKEWNPDLVQTHGRSFLPTMFGLFFSLKLNKKWVYISHKSGYKKGLPKWRLWCTMLYDCSLGKITFGFCNDIISLTKLSCEYIKSLTGKKVSVVYRGIDYPFHILREVKQDLEIRLCFVGNLEKQSGIGVLLRTYAEFRKEHPNTTLTIIGDGSNRGDVDKLVDMLGIKESIHILGKLSKEEIQRDYLKNYDIIVIPTLESDSLIQEEIVWGLFAKAIVVTSDVGAVKEITDKEDLILVKAGDIESLFGGLKIAVNSLDKSGASHDELREKFNWKNRIEEYLAVCYP